MATWIVVEDDPDIHELLDVMFDLWGIDQLSFETGESAKSWIQSVDQKKYKGELPELALLDVRLPGEIDGIWIANRIRNSPLLKNMAIVLMTGNDISPPKGRHMRDEARADWVIAKPLPKFVELQRILNNVVSERQSRV